MKVVDLVRPLLLRFPRPNMVMLGMLGAGYAHDRDWEAVTPRYVSYFDPRLKCIVSADRAEWGGRYCYYWGRFYDLTHQKVLERCLQPGDTYIDIGANLGFQSLFAACLVGPEGLVLSFEPNPDTYAVLQAHVQINRISHCFPSQMALSDEAGELTLSQKDRHSGLATLRAVEGALKAASVPVRIGDEVLAGCEFRGKVFVKIDVEGFELRVLRGLQETLRRADYVNVEVTPRWIEEQGGSAEDLFEFMKNLGFVALVPVLRWTAKVFLPRLVLSAVPVPNSKQIDVLFVRPTFEGLKHE